jgi:putative aldouronate transport system substrate-binding protein
LSGDAIKNYPNLANIPTNTWKVPVQNDGIYGVPLPRTRTGWPMFVNQSRLDDIGATPPRNADDFTQRCKALTNAQAGQLLEWLHGVGEYCTDHQVAHPVTLRT